MGGKAHRREPVERFKVTKLQSYKVTQRTDGNPWNVFSPLASAMVIECPLPGVNLNRFAFWSLLTSPFAICTFLAPPSQQRCVVVTWRYPYVPLNMHLNFLTLSHDSGRLNSLRSLAISS